MAFNLLKWVGLLFCGILLGWQEAGRAAEGPADEAARIAAQIPLYPLQTCVVSGGRLGGMGKTVEYLHGERLVRFCCGGCIEAFKAAPEKYLKALDEAASRNRSQEPARPSGTPAEQP